MLLSTDLQLTAPPKWCVSSCCSPRGPLYAGEVFEILDQILAAIDVAHGSGIVHRDLKPLNVFYEGQVGERAGRSVKIAVRIS